MKNTIFALAVCWFLGAVGTVSCVWQFFLTPRDHTLEALYAIMATICFVGFALIVAIRQPFGD